MESALFKTQLDYQQKRRGYCLNCHFVVLLPSCSPQKQNEYFKAMVMIANSGVSTNALNRLFYRAAKKKKKSEPQAG